MERLQPGQLLLFLLLPSKLLSKLQLLRMFLSEEIMPNGLSFFDDLLLRLRGEIPPLLIGIGPVFENDAFAFFLLLLDAIGWIVDIVVDLL